MSLSAADGGPLAPLIRPYINWAIVPADRIERLEFILGTLDDEHFPGGIIPRVHSGAMRYYAVASSREQWRRLVPLIRASVGATITDFTGPGAPFNEDDPLEAVLIENGYSQGASFTAGADVQRGRYAVAALARLRRLVDESHNTITTQPRATGEVLRAFELSLAALDRRSAEDALAFLRENLRLDAINLGFLTVRLHASFHEWERIRQLDIFTSLCQTRRTPKVTIALAEAVYRTTLLHSERADDPNQAFSFFRTSVLPYVGNLFSSCPALVTPAAAKAFLLAAGTVTPSDRQLADRLDRMSVEWPEHDTIFFRRLFEWGFPAEVPPPEVRAPSVSDFEGQIEVLRTEPDHPSLNRARVGLMAATQLNTLEAFQAVVAYVERLQPDECEVLLDNPYNRSSYNSILEVAGGYSAPKNWAEWITCLETAPLAVSYEFTNRAVSEWRVSEHLRNERDIRDLVKAIESVPTVAQERLFDTIPYLVQWLQEDNSWPASSLLTLYRAIYDHLMLQLSLRWRREAVGAARELLDGILQLGPDKTEYTRLLDDLGDVLPTDVGRTDLDVLLELSELTVAHAAPCPDARQRLWGRIVAALNPVRPGMTNRELLQINDLGEIFGMDEVFPVPENAPEEPTGPSALEGKTVAIYTLTEPVAQRVKRVLNKLHSGLHVDTLHDRVGSPRLAELARRADVFVVCWRSAAHAATEMIERLRPADAVTLRPDGKGSTSILRAIEEHYLT